ncbi:T9SS type A sorting domain-containing protein [Halocola ammonii]
MIRFSVFLLFAFLVKPGSGQNLIPNPSGEELIECPETLSSIETSVSGWHEFRGTSDYFNSCTQNQNLGWNNAIGYQTPRTGEGFFGAVSYSSSPSQENAREYFGVELTQPLELGQTYYMTFFVSAAYRHNVANLFSNNLGCLFMVDNYLPTGESDTIENFSTFSSPAIVSDTTNWTEISFSFVADSAYQFVAFGNFFGDSATEIAQIIEGQKYDALSYYFFDDFCLTTHPDSCEFITEVTETLPKETNLSVFPNPSNGNILLSCDSRIIRIQIFEISGRLVSDYSNMSFENLHMKLESGTYIIKVYTQAGIMEKRIVIIN